MTNSVKLAPPEDLKEWGDGYSNFDGEEPFGADDALRGGDVYLAHQAWDHWGKIWFADGMFHEMIMRHNVHVETVSGESLREVFEKTNDRFGWQ